ncbi:MAG: hypothetical protein K6G55_01900 [Selenomonadaceae bacterium]|nr:hypothetical protein [Selenomonadaceae bacterium]
MLKKFLLMCLVMLIGIQSAASAKEKGLPENERIKVAVEVKDSSRYTEFATADKLETFLANELIKKNFINVTNAQAVGDNVYDVPASAAENIGELLIFDALELPVYSEAKDFDSNKYRADGVNYVLRCEVIGIGARKVKDKNLDVITGVIGAGFSLGGASGDKQRDRNLRRIGTGIGLLSYGSMLDVTKRTTLNTVVSMQFIDATTGEVVWQENFMGEALKHHKPHKGYDNVWAEAYIKSVEDCAKNVSNRVNKYVEKVIVKGKSDKDFTKRKYVVKD